MEATLSLKHHLYSSQPLSQNTNTNTNTRAISINPYLSFSSLHRQKEGSLFRGFRAERGPPRQHFMIKSMAEEEQYHDKVLERSPSTRSLTLASLRSGKVVLEGMLDMKKALRDPKLLDNAEIEFVNLLNEENIDFPKLQRVVWKLEMSGKEDKAVRILKEIYDKEVNNKELKGGDAPNAYELGLLLAELMIYQGNYKPAKRICTTLVNEKPLGDARPLLYLIIANVLLGDISKAAEKWEEFVQAQSFDGREAATANTKKDESSITFEQFKKHIDILEEEIALG